MNREIVLLYLHGIRTMDEDGNWRATLDRALRREGGEALEERGYRVVTPRYLDLLEAEDPPKCSPPEETYVKRSEQVYARAAAAYWSALARLERAGLRDAQVAPGIRGKLPPDTAATSAILRRFFAQAARYRQSRDLRSGILKRALDEIPAESELVIIGHSLGSVVAVDLLYHLDPRSPVRMLVTLGSPLRFKSMREQLTGARSRFPFESVGPWINVVGVGDLVTGFRGLSQIFGEALDLYVDTGIDLRQAHAASTYLDRPPVARAIDWLDREHAPQPRADAAASPRNLPDLPPDGATLSVLIGAQYALRLEQCQEAGDRRSRYAEARRLVMEDLAHKLGDAGFTHPMLARLLRDNGAYLKGRVMPAEVVQFLLSAHTMNPVAPFEIRASADARRRALALLAADLDVPATFAQCVLAAEQQARRSHERGVNLLHVGLIVAGVAAIAAMPMLVLAAAPAGLSGGAAIVAGLAALGPGGMLGGVGILGVLGSAGGAMTAASARALLAGTAEQVEATVIHLQALACARRDLKQDDGTHAEWFALVAMEDVATDAWSRQRRLSDDDAPSVKLLDHKRESVRKALDWMRERGLSPARLATTADGLPVAQEDTGDTG